jgi:hypothetical protein
MGIGLCSCCNPGVTSITNRRKRVILIGMSTGAPRIVSNKCMEGIFRHEDVACVEECLITMQNPSQNRQHYHVDIQVILEKHDKVFGSIHARRPPDRGFQHVIKLEEGARSVITTPYRHPKKFKNEIEKAIQELLEMGHINRYMIPKIDELID